VVAFPLAFPPNTNKRSSSPHSCYMPAHLILLYLIILIIHGKEYKSLSSSLCSFLQSPVTSSFFGPNILSIRSATDNRNEKVVFLSWISSVVSIASSRFQWKFNQFLHLSVICHVPASLRPRALWAVHVRASVHLHLSDTEALSSSLVCCHHGSDLSTQPNMCH
jgi:hypothetical protein